MRSFKISLCLIVSMLTWIFWGQAKSIHAQTATTTDATYEVTVVFMGLMTFKPTTDSAGNVLSATVIVPNVKAGFATPPIGNAQKPIEAHVPYILTHTSHIVSPAVNTWKEAKNEGTTYRFLELNGEQITLDDENRVPENNAALKTSTVQPNVLDGEYCPDVNTVTSLYWLSSMKRVTGTAQVEDTAGHFNPRATSDKPIVARTIVRYGSLAPHVMKESPVWEFRVAVLSGPPNPPTHIQAIAQEVHWTFKASGEPFILNLIGFAGGVRHVAFKPDSGTRKLKIIIGNTTFKDTGPLGPPQAHNFDHDYAVYHRFVANNTAGNGPIPHLKQNFKCDETYLFDPALQRIASTTSTASRTGHAVHAGRGSALKKTGDPAPSGLNCGANNWP